MAEMDNERLQLADEVRHDLASENRLTANQARAFVRGLQISWGATPIQWRDDESAKQFTDARRLMHAADIFSSILGPDSSGAKDCYRRAGEILEWLSRASDPLERIAPLELLSAAAFQLGGLPAMAQGLLGQIPTDTAGARLYANFLKADFDGVVREAAAFWSENPELTERGVSERLLAESLEWYFTVELVRCLGLIANSLRQSQGERLNRAIEKLRALDRTATRMFDDEIALLISLFSAVADRYIAASIYEPIRRLVARFNPQSAQRLSQFARGQFSRGRGILWASQLHGLDRLLNSSSFALCTPTGSGKTLVANLALIKELLLVPEEVAGPLALYLVPSRALAGEVEAKLTSELGNDAIITGLYGGADWGITDYWLSADRPTVLIATVEKADALMRYVGPLILARLRILIVDEAHQVVPDDSGRTISDFEEHQSRSLRLEALVSRILARSPGIARIALTAVAGGAATPVARWIEGNADAEPIGTDYRSTRQIVGVLEATPHRSGRMSLNLMNGEPLQIADRQGSVFIPLTTPPMPALPPGMRSSLNRFNELNVLWTAMQLAGSDRRILISVAQQPEQTMRWFTEALQLPEWAEVRNSFEAPEDPMSRACFEEARASCIDYCGQNSFELTLLECGIATSHGQMPQRLRRLMTVLIDKKICPITVATATLTEGVNLPFDIIFVTSLKRRSFNQVTQRPEVVPLSTAEFRNLAGRAGRPGTTKGLEGMTLVALPQQPPTTAAKLVPKQRKQLNQLAADYERLLASLREEDRPGHVTASPLTLLLHHIADMADTHFGLRGDDFLRWLETISPERLAGAQDHPGSIAGEKVANSVDELDSVLLTAIEELSVIQNQALTPIQVEELLINLWRRTFSHVATAQEYWLEQAFVRRGQGLIENVYVDPQERRRLYQYGFSPYVGRRFEQIAPLVRDAIEHAVGYGDYEKADQFAVFCQIAELMATGRGFGFRARNTVSDIELMNDWPRLLAWWLQIDNADSPNPDDLRAWQRFVTENFEFRLGVAIGAVVAQAWTAGADDPLAVPSLEEWRQTTGLPWFGFWARELLRWGTLDPFVAFALAQGLAKTRGEAARRRPEFERWLDNEYGDLEADDWIDPQFFIEWQHSLAAHAAVPPPPRIIQANLRGATGKAGRYNVFPVHQNNETSWIDPAGFRLATSLPIHDFPHSASRDDFELNVSRGVWSIVRTFRAS